MKKLITNYTFDASAKTVTFNDYVIISHGGLLLITNVLDNIIIYNFVDSTVGGTVFGNVVTLTYDTTSMSDSDPLQIFYEDGKSQEVTADQALKYIMAVLESPVWLSKTYNALQTVLVSGSTTAVTGTLTGLTNIGGLNADTLIPSELSIVWATCIRNNLT